MDNVQKHNICTTGYSGKKGEIWILDNTWNITNKKIQVNIQMCGMYNTDNWKEVEK
jgi:hypothetical protein